MSTAAEYRARAAICKGRASEADDHYVKQEFEILAQKWIELARQVEDGGGGSDDA
jgi:hypothetical protein